MAGPVIRDPVTSDGPTVSDIVNDPAWFLDRIVPQLDVAVLKPANRQVIAEGLFLDHRWSQDATTAKIPLGALRDYAGEDRPAMIWHTAFCCSTLIADLLDTPGVCLALKEPGVLLDLAAARRAGAPAADDRLSKAVLTRLARSPTTKEQVVIKPSNGANSLLSIDTGGQALMLYSTCRDFVVSVVAGLPAHNGGEDRKRFARTLMLDRATSERPNIPWRPFELCVMTDLQIAALLWHVQVMEFRAVARQRGPARVRSLDCADFLADPQRALAALDDFLGLKLGPARINTAVGGEKLSRHAKTPEAAFSARRRAESMAAAAEAIGPVLDAVVNWSYQVCPATPPGDPIGAPLLAAA